VAIVQNGYANSSKKYFGIPALTGSITSKVKTGTVASRPISLEAILNSHGFTNSNKVRLSGHETKVLGSLTKKALKNYQKSVGLKQTGTLISATIAT